MFGQLLHSQFRWIISRFTCVKLAVECSPGVRYSPGHDVSWDMDVQLRSVARGLRRVRPPAYVAGRLTIRY